MNKGRHCDNCNHHLSEKDYARYGGWSYKCPRCGFEYNHSSSLTADQQVEAFNEDDEADEEE